MSKLKISGALQYLLWFLGRNERNKCGGMPKWLYMVGNLRKKKVDCSRKDQVKKKSKKKMVLKKKMWEKKWRKKRSSSAIWVLLCKVSGIGIIWKEKLCSTSL